MQMWIGRFPRIASLIVAMWVVAKSQPSTAGSIQEKVEQTVESHQQFIEGHRAYCLDDRYLTESESAELQAAEQRLSESQRLHARVFIGAQSPGFGLRRTDPIRIQMLFCLRLQHSLASLTLVSRDAGSREHRVEEIEQTLADLKSEVTQLQQQAQRQPDMSEVQRSAMMDRVVAIDTQYRTLQNEQNQLTALASMGVQDSKLPDTERADLDQVRRAADDRLVLLEQRATTALEEYAERCQALAVETRNPSRLKAWGACMADREREDRREWTSRGMRVTDIHPEIARAYGEELERAGLQCAETSGLMARFDAFSTQCVGDSPDEFLLEGQLRNGQDCHRGLLDHSICVYALMESGAARR